MGRCTRPSSAATVELALLWAIFARRNIIDCGKRPMTEGRM
jgi:hypothetical protein